MAETCAAACPWPCPASASGATTSAASRARPDPAVFKRWIAFGLLSSHSRLHGSTVYRVPWLFDEEAVDVLRHFTRLKAQLMPYLYGAGASQAHRDRHAGDAGDGAGVPRRPGLRHLDRQYMLGDRLLVAPVFSAHGEVVVLHPGRHLDPLQTGATVRGPRWVREEHDFQTVPIFVRPGSVLPVGARDDRPDYAYDDDVTLRAYEFPTAARRR